MAYLGYPGGLDNQGQLWTRQSSILFPLLKASSSTEPSDSASLLSSTEGTERAGSLSESSHFLCFPRMLELKIAFYFSESKIAIFKMGGKALGNFPISDKKQKDSRFSTKGPVGDPFI